MFDESDAARDRLQEERLNRLNLLTAGTFMIGSILFAVGALLAELGAGSRELVNVTYLVGGVFFSVGAYASIQLAGSAFEPRRRAWTSAVVMFVGTLLFGVSLVAAFANGLTPRQSDSWIWFPDNFGCICFLISGHLAMLDVGSGHIVVRVHELAWWVVALNQIGSVLFFLAGLAAFTSPATWSEVAPSLVNWGTFAGALCFAVAGVVQAFDTPTSTSLR